MSLAINRAIGAMERRWVKSMNLRSNSFEEMTWPEISDQLMQNAENVLDRQYERRLGDGKGISRDIDPYLDRLTDYTTDEGQLLELLGIMTEGQRLVFDRRTHRQGYQITHRLNYAFLAGQMLQDRPIPEVSDQVLEQLEGAQRVLQETWGRFEWDRLSQNHVVLDQLENRLKARLAELIGTERFAEVCNQPLESLRPEEREVVQDTLGWFDQNEATRQLLLSVISDLWVDYLTRVEGLRVSIGLEAYAQRDPLVQYKGRASEMFQQLLADIRIGVISRLYSFRPRPQVPSPTISEARTDGASGNGSGFSEAAPEPAQIGKPSGNCRARKWKKEEA